MDKKTSLPKNVSPPSSDPIEVDREDVLNKHTQQIESMEKSIEEVKDLKNKVMEHERNTIATMGILFSLFVGISAAMSIFSFAKKATIGEALVIILGVILVVLTVTVTLVYAIKVLFTHPSEESTTISVINRLFIRLVKGWLVPLTYLFLAMSLLMAMIITQGST